MKTIKKITIAPEFVEFIPEKLKENTLYISEEYTIIIHLCLCGCGNKSVTPINKNGWVLANNNGLISLTPSILNNNCPNRYHYIITNNIANVV